MRKIIRVEALRGFVALYVVLAHLFHLDFGDTGVVIFFVISGFAIQLSFSKSKDKTFKTFFLKRFFRIYIPLIFVFITSYFLFSVSNVEYYFSWKQVISNLLMIQHLHTYPFFWPLFSNGPLWSLAYEWWYYMLFFFLMTILPKKADTIVYTICVAGTIINIYFFQFFISSVMTDLSLWWLGAEMAKSYINKGKIAFTFTELRSPLLMIVFSTVVLFFADSEFYVHLFSGLCCVIIGIFWCKYNWCFFDKLIGLFLPLGRISYTIYIAHYPLLIQATYLDSYIVSNLMKNIIYFIVLIIYCYLIEVVIYPPLYNFFKHRFIDKNFVRIVH